MICKTIVIPYPIGLHARPAGKFVRLLKGFESEITIRNISRNGEMVNAKSLVKVVKIACVHNHEAEICFNGVDEKEASEAVDKFLTIPQEEL